MTNGQSVGPHAVPSRESFLLFPDDFLPERVAGE